MKKLRNNLKNLILIILVIVCSFFLEASIYYKSAYPKQDFDLIVFTLRAGVAGSSPDVIKSIIFSCLGQFITLLLFFYLTLVKKTKHTLSVNVSKKNKQNKSIQLFPVKLTSNHRFLYMLFIVVVTISVFTKSFGLDEYIRYRLQDSTIFDDYYISAQSVDIKFPERKRNLILIIGESFENTFISEKNGGAWSYSIMPELEDLALNNINFSHTSNTIGGAQQIYGTDYSAAGNIAITAGIPQKVGDFTQDANQYVNSYSGSKEFLSGAYSLGEVLQDNGYNNEIIMGSDGHFGNRKQYYESNGNYKVFDLYYAVENGKMTIDEKVWWGFDDDHLFEWSKEEILNLANQNQPFNYIMLTADTHPSDGYRSENVGYDYPIQYENVYAYSSKCVNSFVNWVKQQDFYKDTTIVIVGDHLCMQASFYTLKADDSYTRTVYNTFINSAIPAKNTQNRIFTLMDMYPTILASMGADIEGERLGLGTNLFSGKQTLAEELGLDYLEDEIHKRSDYYNTHIVGNDYYTMKKEYDNQKRKEEENS